MKQVEELRRNKEEGKDRIRQARITMHKSWGDHLVDYVRDSYPTSESLAVARAPFLSDIPEQALQGILPPDCEDVDPLWDALKVALPHLNRRRRKALHKSRSWIVHLFAGPSSHKSFAALERDGAVVLELDVCCSSSQNFYRDPLWALLVCEAWTGFGSVGRTSVSHHVRVETPAGRPETSSVSDMPELLTRMCAA